MRSRALAGFAAGPLITAALGFITFPIVAWLFSPIDIGRLNVFNVAIGLGTILLTLGLDQAYLREYHEVADKRALLRSCAQPGLMVLLLIGVPWLIFAGEVSEWLFAADVPSWSGLLYISLLVSLVSRFLALVLRMQERGLAFSVTQVLPKLVLIAALGSVGLAHAPSTFTTLAGMSTISLLSVLGVFVAVVGRGGHASKGAGPPPGLGSLLRYGLPLTLAGIAYWGLNTTSTISLRALSTLPELGVYSITVSAAGVAFVAQRILSTIWAPIVFRWSAEQADLAKVEEVARLGALLAISMVSLVGIASGLLNFILPTSYAGVDSLVACAMLPPLLYSMSEITGVGISLERRTGWALSASVAGLIANAALCWLLVPTLGAAGAVVSNAAAFFLFFAIRTEISARIWRSGPRRSTYLGFGVAAATSIAIAATGAQGPWIATAWLALISAKLWASRADLIDLWAALSRRHRRSTTAA